MGAATLITPTPVEALAILRPNPWMKDPGVNISTPSSHPTPSSPVSSSEHT